MKVMRAFPRNRQQWLDILNQPVKTPLIGFQDLKFSVRGFSAKRLALLLNGVQLWLLATDFMEAYYDDGLGVFVGSLTLVLVNLFLGVFSPRSDKSRFFPFALAVVLLVLTNLCMPP
jgi:hypothetical protein